MIPKILSTDGIPSDTSLLSVSSEIPSGVENVPDEAQITRRTLLALAPAAFAISGCRWFDVEPMLPIPPTLQLVDAHCHVFNGSDLPAARFIRITFIESFEPEGFALLAKGLNILTIEDKKTFLDYLCQLLLWFVGIDEAPTAAEEIQILDGSPPSQMAEEPTLIRQFAINRLSNFLKNPSSGPTFQRPPFAPLATEAENLLANSVKQKFRAEALAETARQKRGQLAAESIGDVIGTILDSPWIFARYIRWFSLYRRYRYSLVDQLVRYHRAQGFNATVLAPAVIDYSYWLGESTNRSPLRKQMMVMDRISRRPNGPAIHGYMGFDPLHEIFFRKGIAYDKDSSLALVTDALKTHGFMGVKIYSPMGYRPTHNEQSGDKYPEPVLKTLKMNDAELGKNLDAVLEELYALCARTSAPIMTHTLESNEAGKNFGQRAAPTGWLPVFMNHPTLKVCLGHFGSFSLTYGTSTVFDPTITWEWTLAEYLKKNPDAPIYGDISYLSELLGSDTKTKDNIRTGFKAFIDYCDSSCNHLMFGTDWNLLAREADADKFTYAMYRFLKVECKLSDDSLQRIFHDNALKFLGLDEGGATRIRMQTYYDERAPGKAMPF